MIILIFYKTQEHSNPSVSKAAQSTWSCPAHTGISLEGWSEESIHLITPPADSGFLSGLDKDWVRYSTFTLHRRAVSITRGINKAENWVDAGDYLMLTSSFNLLWNFYLISNIRSKTIYVLYIMLSVISLLCLSLYKTWQHHLSCNACVYAFIMHSNHLACVNRSRWIGHDWLLCTLVDVASAYLKCTVWHYAFEWAISWTHTHTHTYIYSI